MKLPPPDPKDKIRLQMYKLIRDGVSPLELIQMVLSVNTEVEMDDIAGRVAYDKLEKKIFRGDVEMDDSGHYIFTGRSRSGKSECAITLANLIRRMK